MAATHMFQATDGVDVHHQGLYSAWLRDTETSIPVARQLLGVLTRVKIVLLVDDSGSMNSRIIEPPTQGSAPVNLFSSAAAVLTRWGEAQKAAVALVNMITAATVNGLDVWFLNRPGMQDVKRPSDLAEHFSAPPTGSTPLIGVLGNIINEYSPICDMGYHVLLLTITDGEPSDGSVDNLKRRLTHKPRDFHISFIECNDNEEEMAWMDSLDGQVHNFHNSDDYRMEMLRVKQQQGQAFKFTYNDYIISAVLSTFCPRFFLLDQTRASRVTITQLPPLPEHTLDWLMSGGASIPAASTSSASAVPVYAQPPASQQSMPLPTAPAFETSSVAPTYSSSAPAAASYPSSPSASPTPSGLVSFAEYDQRNQNGRAKSKKCVIQ